MNLLVKTLIERVMAFRDRHRLSDRTVVTIDVPEWAIDSFSEEDRMIFAEFNIEVGVWDDESL